MNYPPCIALTLPYCDNSMSTWAFDRAIEPSSYWSLDSSSAGVLLPPPSLASTLCLPEKYRPDIRPEQSACYSYGCLPKCLTAACFFKIQNFFQIPYLTYWKNFLPAQRFKLDQIIWRLKSFCTPGAYVYAFSAILHCHFYTYHTMNTTEN